MLRSSNVWKNVKQVKPAAHGSGLLGHGYENGYGHGYGFFSTLSAKVKVSPKRQAFINVVVYQN